MPPRFIFSYHDNMEGNTPAPWFLEVDGEKQGPYTSQKIMELVMEGALKLESKIFDADADKWKIAADVVPYLDLGALPDSGYNSNWSPPTRPTELRDVHVIRLDGEGADNIDYFALIRDRRKEIEKADHTLHSKSMLAANRKNRPAKIVRVPPPIEGQSASSSVTPSQSSNPTNPDHDEIQHITRFGQFQTFIRQHSGALSMAAGIALVFAGTFGMIRSLSKSTSRIPASETLKHKIHHVARTHTRQHSQKHGELLGTGHHQIRRPSGSVSSLRHALRRQTVRRAVHPAVAKPSAAELRRRYDEPPQFISTVQQPRRQQLNGQFKNQPNGAPPATPLGARAEGYPPSKPYYPNRTGNPNAGPVTPPNFPGAR